MTDIPKISRLQLFLITFVAIAGGAINILPGSLIMTAKNDAWLSVIITTIMTCIFTVLLVKLSTTSTYSNFLELLTLITGKYVGRILCFLYSFYYLQISAQLINMNSFYINIIYFPETPMIVLITLIIIILFIVNYYGLKILCRFNELIFPIMFIGILLTVLLAIPLMDLSNLLPILDNGIKPVISTSLPLLGVPFAEIFIIVILYPYLNNQNHFKKIGLLIVLASGLLLLIITLTTIFFLNINEAELNYFTSSEIARLISIGGSQQRLDTIYVLAYLLAILIKISIFSYIGLLLFSQTFNVKKVTTLSVPLLIITAAYSWYVADSYIELMHLTKILSGPQILFGYIIPIILLIIYNIKKNIKNRLINK